MGYGSPMEVVILHGWQGNAPGHWQTWLAEQLAENGATVAYPDLPDPDWPTLDAWLAAIAEELQQVPADALVVCHSLACVTWLHRVARVPAEADRRVLLVAPPADLDELPPGFFPIPDDVRVPNTELWCADDDPYCPGGAASVYGERFELPTRVFKGGQHLNTDAGYGPWPAALEWCQSPSGAKNGVET